MPPTGGDHSSISGNLHVAVGHWVLTHHLGTVQSAEAGFRLAPGTILAADVSFVHVGRAATLTTEQRKRYWPLAPDLVAEVVSPSQAGGQTSKAHADLEAKARAWVSGGVRLVWLVWLVWPETQEVAVWRMDTNIAPPAPRQIALLSRAHGDALDGLDVLPGFTYPLADLFTLDY